MPGRVENRIGAVGRARGQLGRGALGQDAAVVDDDHVVGQALRLGQLVGGQDHADAPVALGGDDVAHHQAPLGIDPGRGLVEEQHLGLPHQGQGQGQALLLPAGQPPPRRAPDMGQAHQVEQAVGVLGVVVVTGEQVEHLGRSEHGVDAAPSAASPRCGPPGRRGPRRGSRPSTRADPASIGR